MSWLAKAGDWLDSRTSYRALLHHALDEPVPGGARWASKMTVVPVALKPGASSKRKSSERRAASTAAAGTLPRSRPNA